MIFVGWETLLQIIVIAATTVMAVFKFDYKNFASVGVVLIHIVGLFGIIFLAMELTMLIADLAMGMRTLVVSGIYLCIIMLYVFLFGRCTWMQKVTLGITLFAAVICSTEFAGALGVLAGIEWLRSALIFVILVFGVFVQRFNLSKCDTFPLSGFILLMAVDVSVIIIILYGQYNALSIDEDPFYTLLSFILLCILLFSYFSLYNISVIMSEKLQIERENSILKSEAEMMRMSERKIAELRELRHDAKNLLEYMDAGEGNASGGEFRERLRKRLQDSAAGIDCGNRVIDSVINMKMAALPDGIAFDTRISVPSRLPFEEMDLCQILCNLIDNAADATERLGPADAVIGIEICPRQDYLYIGVRNPLPPGADTARMERLETQKGEGHGYGTRIVRRIAEKYNGFASWGTEGDVFIAEAMLDLLWERGASPAAGTDGAERPAGGGKE